MRKSEYGKNIDIFKGIKKTAMIALITTMALNCEGGGNSNQDEISFAVRMKASNVARKNNITFKEALELIREESSMAKSAMQFNQANQGVNVDTTKRDSLDDGSLKK